MTSLDLPTEKVDVLIVGAGPAGTSTALHLLQASPHWADRMALVDKAVHPRHKLCGGGVTPFGVQILARLGLAFEPPHLPVTEIRLVYGRQRFALRDESILRVVRREEFDHWLLQKVAGQGVTVHQGEAVHAVRRYPTHVEVLTARRRFEARVLVAADGANSLVRRQLQLARPGHTARLLEVLTPEDPASCFEFQERVAVFDFSPMAHGLQGYYWDFPSFIQGRAFMNRGVYDARIHARLGRASLRQQLTRALASRGREGAAEGVQGHPIRWFDPGTPLSAPRVLFVGDAAGVDPLFGEGIAFALAYGDAAAAEIQAAFARGDFSFAGYRRRLLGHPILGQLRRRGQLARLLYWLAWRPRLAALAWATAPWLLAAIAHLRPRYVPIRDRRMVRLSPGPASGT
ncbi:MAG: geranylgeranyl reductase [Litorilinea sp.]|nr:MAG: geranylgeranyl reductase [Litorilinea sp.]